MTQHYVIMDRKGNLMREGEFSEPEVRMAAKAGYRIFEDGNKEITPVLTGLFEHSREDGSV